MQSQKRPHLLIPHHRKYSDVLVVVHMVLWPVCAMMDQEIKLHMLVLARQELEAWPVLL